MKTTNRYNLPEAFFEAMKERRGSFDLNKLTVTELISPPLIRYLKILHWNELETDVSERLWALLGTAAHSVLEKHAPDNSLSEEILETKIGDMTIVGKMDLYVNNPEKGIHNHVEDYKVTSVWSFLFAGKTEWEQQLNCYAWLLRVNGWEVEHLFINAILRDWQKSKVNELNYPEIPFIRKEINLWTFEEQQKFVEERIELFKQAPKECSDEEKWARGGEYALMQSGKKRALKLFQTEDEMKYVILDKDQKLVQRPKVYVRCRDYCPVRSVCVYNPYKGGNNEFNSENTETI